MSLSKLDLIRGAAKALSAARAKLSASVGRLHLGIKKLEQRHLPIIRRHVGVVADAHANLDALLKGAPELFKEPRSITEAGIKVGYQAHKASITMPRKAEELQKLVTAIRRDFTPAEIEVLGLVKTVELPVGEKILEHLSEKQIKKLGLAYEPAGEHILIKPADSAVDKTVAKLLEVATEAAEEKGEEAA